MKKSLVLFLALTFVFSLAAVAFAGVSISGDARVRGIANNNYTANGTTGNFDTNTDRDNHYWDQRVRLNVTGDVGNGIEMRARLTTGDDTWDGGNNTSNALTTDYAYLHVPVAGFVIDAGRMKRSWGHKLLRWDATMDALEVSTNLGDTQVALFTEKVNESNAVGTGSNNLEDDDNHGIFIKHSAGNLEAGLILIRELDQEAATNTSGTEGSLYVNTTVGAISIAAEAAMKEGKITGNEDANGNSMKAAFISASTDVGAMAVSLTGAIAKDGYVADDNFTPSVFFGTDNPTAVADFQAAASSTSWAVVVGASTDVSSDISVNGKLLYADLENLGAELGGTDSAKESVTEIDLGLSYKIADNASYSIDLGYLMPDNITTRDDNAMAIAHKIEVSF